MKQSCMEFANIYKATIYPPHMTLITFKGPWRLKQQLNPNLSSQPTNKNIHRIIHKKKQQGTAAVNPIVHHIVNHQPPGGVITNFTLHFLFAVISVYLPCRKVTWLHVLCFSSRTQEWRHIVHWGVSVNERGVKLRLV